jgi:hypothetical protein
VANCRSELKLGVTNELAVPSPTSATAAYSDNERMVTFRKLVNMAKAQMQQRDFPPTHELACKNNTTDGNPQLTQQIDFCCFLRVILTMSNKLNSFLLLFLLF